MMPGLAASSCTMTGLAERSCSRAQQILVLAHCHQTSRRCGVVATAHTRTIQIQLQNVALQRFCVRSLFCAGTLFVENELGICIGPASSQMDLIWNCRITRNSHYGAKTWKRSPAAWTSHVLKIGHSRPSCTGQIIRMYGSPGLAAPSVESGDPERQSRAGQTMISV